MLVTNAVYLLSAYEGNVSWCMPYIEGCTTISQAARSGNSIYIYRDAMIAYGVLLIWFWIYAQRWLNLLYGRKDKIARIMLWLGITGALFLIIYIDFLGTTGEVNRFMRRYGILVFFTFTPLAMLLLLLQQFEISSLKTAAGIKTTTLNSRALKFQLFILLLMLLVGIISIDINQVTVAGLNFRILEYLHDISQHVTGGIIIVSIKNSDNITRSHLYTLVHRIVDALVRFGDDVGESFTTVFNDFQCIVRRPTINHDMLDVNILSTHRFNTL